MNGAKKPGCNTTADVCPPGNAHRFHQSNFIVFRLSTGTILKNTVLQQGMSICIAEFPGWFEQAYVVEQQRRYACRVDARDRRHLSGGATLILSTGETIPTEDTTPGEECGGAPVAGSASSHECRLTEPTWRFLQVGSEFVWNVAWHRGLGERFASPAARLESVVDVDEQQG